MNQHQIPRALFAAALLAAQAAVAALPSADAVRQATGIDSGLVVVVGSTDGALEAALAKSGAVLVHGLALDEIACGKARAALFAQGVQGLATVEV